MYLLTIFLTFLLGLHYSNGRIVDPIHPTQRPLVPSHTKPTPTAAFQHEFQLDSDGNFWLFWNVSGTNITFETHVRTRGYVGFGLSSNGKMFPSDVVVGWVKDGTAVLKDCHTTGHFTPEVDTSQDWHLISGFENDFGTVLTFSRKLDTCDDNDTIITDDTVKAIYSYHPDDPDSVQGMQWHGVKRRGAQSLMFLSSTKSDVSIPANNIHIDLVSPNFAVPSVDTRYQCTIHKIPTLTKKHHMIRYEPVIQRDNIDYVHHAVITTCPEVTEADVGTSFECYSRGTPRRFQTCSEVVVAWAVGGVAFNMPEHVGFAFGEADSPKYLRLEMHYNNPTMKSDIVDSSGIRLILTPDTRQFDAAGMSVGVNVDPTHFIPPYQKAFLSTGYCSPECTEKGLPETGIKIFGLLQHAHLLGAGIKTRHIRNGTELSPIAEDDHYDFNYQDIRVLKEEREVKRGDSFIVECTYDSSRRNKPTIGGLSTQEEMCVSFLYYYPRTTMSLCLGLPVYDQISKDPSKAVEQFKGWNWRDNNVQHMFQDLVNNSTYRIICNGPERLKIHRHFSVVPKPDVPFQKPQRQCS
ncbi:DBH-like monooxygenase protein 1 [Mytilus trossulus]|uniref:DBH-like monooxygenase protein 1 n=1 Tax=Mytilus trossulus TaxID=6551 RepID=UPI003004605E